MCSVIGYMFWVLCILRIYLFICLLQLKILMSIGTETHKPFWNVHKPLFGHLGKYVNPL
jgi:hypothetical protein